MADMVKGTYVRYPIIQELPVDLRYPRTFALGQIVDEDKLAGTVTIKAYDLMGSKAYYPHAFDNKTYMPKQLIRAKSPVNFPVETPDGRGTILQCVKPKDSPFYYYYVSIPGKPIKPYP